MSDRFEINGLKIHPALYKLVEDEIAPGTGVDVQSFWSALGELVKDLGPINKALLHTRNELQAKIDEWHANNPDASLPNEAYIEFLKSIGYLLPEGDDFVIETVDV
ncbi:MAG: malate synthase G, partial [Verrucomicrobia bacterium]|nr:malate synthase G [Verrucomicrobiota bacterium]